MACHDYDSILTQLQRRGYDPFIREATLTAMNRHYAEAILEDFKDKGYLTPEMLELAKIVRSTHEYIVERAEAREAA